MTRRTDSDGPEPTYQPEDMVLCPPTAEAVGLVQRSLDEVIDMVSTLPFGSSMRATSMLAAELYHHSADRQRNADLAAIIYREPIASRVHRFMSAGPGRLAFDPRHVSSLQRLLILHANADEELGDMSSAEIATLGEALFHVGDALPGGEPTFDGDPSTPEDWADWARYTTLIDAWHHLPQPVEAVARAHAWYVDVHGDPAMAAHHARCDVDAWLREDYGLTFAEQFAGGLACAAVTEALDPTASLEQRAKAIPLGFTGDSALASKEPALRALLSASREELASTMTVIGNDPARIAWDHTAFEQSPFLRTREEQLRLISPAALLSWLTRGMHHRALQAARRRPHPNKPAETMVPILLGYAGALGEEAVRRLVLGSHDTQLRAGLARAYGEHPYKIAKKTYRSPDIALDYGLDLVVIEVFSGRISRDARTTLDPTLLSKALDNATTRKLVELAARLGDLLNGAPVYPELDLGSVRRIWPALVLAADPILQTPALWTYLRDTAPEAFVADPRVKDPQILNLDDLEPLLSLVQDEGKVLPELLQQIADSPYALLPAKNWVHAAFGGVKRRPVYTDDQHDRAMRLTLTTTYPQSRRLSEPMD